MAIDENKPAQAVKIRLSYQNACSLKYDAADLRLRKLPEASGVEPREPSQVDSAAQPEAVPEASDG